MATVRVTAYGRVKPCPPEAVSQDISLEIGPRESRVVFTDNNAKPESFRFKKIFDETSTQAEIFDVVGRPLIENSPVKRFHQKLVYSTLKGYNSTILSYGQTGTGKTFTMTGEFHDPEYYGLIPRTIEEIFKNMMPTTEITISYFEIYNEHVYDLIKNDEQSDFEISETGPLSNNLGLAFRSLSRYKVSTVEQAMTLLLQGDSKKMLAQTCSNERSSRSHTIFAIGLKSPHPNGTRTYVNPVLLLVDLAGSENLSKYKGNSNFFETRYINLSLHYLEQVLLALRRPKRIHIPYRNSVMTTFLKNSLGGSCITAVIATFSIAADCLQETRQTCRFAVNVAYIKNELKVTEETHYAKKLEDLQREVESLRTQLHLLTKEESMKVLTVEDKEACIKEMQKFIREGITGCLPLKDSKKIKFCFHLLRKKILKMSDQKNQTEPKIRLSQFYRMESENLRKRTILNAAEITVEKNWRNQKQPMELPKVNIMYDNMNSHSEEITEKENFPPGVSSSVQITESEFKLLEAVRECKLQPRLPVKVKWSDTTCGTNASEISSEQTVKAPRSRDPTKSSSEAKSNIDSSGESITGGISNELIKSSSLLDPIRVEESEYAVMVDEEKCDEERSVKSCNVDKELPLTGDEDVDEEIIKFYKSRYEHFKEK